MPICTDDWLWRKNGFNATSQKTIKTLKIILKVIKKLDEQSLKYAIFLPHAVYFKFFIFSVFASTHK